MNTFLLNEDLQQIWNQSYEKPTPIQEETFSLILKGESVLGISPTGSGKTLAFGLPAMMRLKEIGSGQLLVLAPSQELAIQIADVLRPFAKALDFKVASLVGGGNSKRQMETLKKKPEVLVGTPGRVLEFLKTKKIKWNDLKIVILDETDHLLEEDGNLTEKVLRHGIPEYQLIGFSATATKEKNVRELFKESTIVDVTAKDDSTKGITESYVLTENRKKVQTLRRLSYVEGMSGLVFFNQLQDLGSAYDKLQFDGVPVASLASDEDKFMRKMAITAFKEGKVKFLLTTDVAARGIDLPDLPYVIFYDLPQNQEQYTHRKGRTGRMGKAGEVLFLMEEKDQRILEKYTKDALEKWIYSGQLVTEEPVKQAPSDKKKSKKTKKKNRS